MSKKYCYLFTEGNAAMRELLGGKGANLAEMTNIGLPVPQGFTSESFSEYVLERAAVMLTPGNGYGPNGEGYFRISLTLPEERVAEAAQRLREKLDKVTF